MIISNYLIHKYSIGIIYVSPAAIDYFDSKIRRTYYCEATIDQIINDYAFHYINIPTNNCIVFKILSESDR